MNGTFSNVLKNNIAKIATLFFLLLSCWWILIMLKNYGGDYEKNAFTLVYPLMSLLGGIVGIIYSRKWGGFRSYLGSAIIMLSLGLLAQFFGQASYAYEIFINGIDVPYPSFGDIGYFGSVLSYIYAVFLLCRISGVSVSMRNVSNKIWAIVVPAVMVFFSYYFFLSDYVPDYNDKLKIFLDFGYPVGQAIYVSIAILALVMSAKVLGGVMRGPTLFIVFALIFQYFSDFMFLYQENKGTWAISGVNDYLYAASYFLMTIGLIYMGNMFSFIQASKQTEDNI